MTFVQRSGDIPDGQVGAVWEEFEWLAAEFILWLAL